MGWRVGSVPYVNAAPLVWGLADRGIEVVYDLPSRLPALLEAGAVDAILVSSIYGLVNPDLRMVGSVGIASYGPVTSVKVFSRLPLKDIQTLALDSSSMTSNRLAIEILHSRGATPTTVSMAPDLDTMLASYDACVLIGDIGMSSHSAAVREYDLGEEWKELTGLPFLWAGWVGSSSLSDELADLLVDAGVAAGCGVGLAQDPTLEIAREGVIKLASETSGLPEAVVRTYLTETMSFQLTDSVKRGYQEYARRIKAPHFPIWIGARDIHAVTAG